MYPRAADDHTNLKRPLDHQLFPVAGKVGQPIQRLMQGKGGQVSSRPLLVIPVSQVTLLPPPAEAVETREANISPLGKDPQRQAGPGLGVQLLYSVN